MFEPYKIESYEILVGWWVQMLKFSIWEIYSIFDGNELYLYFLIVSIQI